MNAGLRRRTSVKPSRISQHSLLPPARFRHDRWRASARSACLWIAKGQPKPSPFGFPWHPAFSIHCHAACGCGSLALISSNSMSHRESLQFQHLNISDYSFYPTQVPFPLQRRCRGIVFPILLRRLALVVSGCRSGGFLASASKRSMHAFRDCTNSRKRSRS
jgi:hypothetical protein